PLVPALTCLAADEHVHVGADHGGARVGGEVAADPLPARPGRAVEPLVPAAPIGAAHEHVQLPAHHHHPQARRRRPPHPPPPPPARAGVSPPTPCHPAHAAPVRRWYPAAPSPPRTNASTSPPNATAAGSDVTAPPRSCHAAHADPSKCRVTSAFDDAVRANRS